jgi:spectinomycin phosphotransferase
VKEPPDDIDERALAAVLREHWDLAVDASGAGLRYAPVGFGDHHWVAVDRLGDRWFVTVADGALAGLRAAMDTAVWLAHDAGLGFVLPPVPTSGGETVRPLGPRRAVTLFPYVHGVPGEFGDATTPQERATVLGLLAQLHRATPASLPSVPVRDPALPGRAVVESALAEWELNEPWSGGPYAEPARALLARHGGAAALRGVLARFDELAERVRAERRVPVVTHGEPHPGNVLRVGGRRLLIDWDTVGLAPPERDLWMLGDDAADFEAYAAATGREVSRAALALYRLRWDLDDISFCLGTFRSPHRRTPDTELAFRALPGALERAVAALAQEG